MYCLNIIQRFERNFVRFIAAEKLETIT